MRARTGLTIGAALIAILLAGAFWVRSRAFVEKPPGGANTSGQSVLTGDRLGADKHAYTPQGRAGFREPKEYTFAPAGGGSNTPIDVEAARRARAEFTLGSYLDWAQYPPHSRPARERPDRMMPVRGRRRSLPLAGSEGGTDSARVILWQSRSHVAGAENVGFAIACERDGAPLPCAVSSAVATPELAGGPQPSPVVFVPDPKHIGAAYTLDFHPDVEGFHAYTGPIGVTALVTAGAETQTASFVFEYTSDPPATFTGRFTEAMNHGSLSICAGLLVRETGRYLFEARVADAEGTRFAFVTADVNLAAGPGEACFVLFGKLVLDENAAAPFTLLDVEGFVLLEEAFPDRHTVPALPGNVYTTHFYADTSFSSDEWESAAKTRMAEGLARAVGE
ncbi:MAG: hypothetical protein IPK82_36480 [Polyangiaceae bacterium]|nr:hypothetical protein [Polyangiaceae bacterium]